MKLQHIKAILMDVDGVLTDGSITLDAQGEEIKTFHVRDGQLVRFMQEKGIFFGAISGRESKAARQRLEALKFDFIRLGQDDKANAYAIFKTEFKLADSDILYIGDDVIDLPILQQVGVAVAPADASHYLNGHVHFHTRSKGGKGVLREVIDLMIHQNHWDIWSKDRSGIGFKK